MKIILLSFSLLSIFVTYAQNFNGRAFYQSKTTFDIEEISSDNLDNSMRKIIIEKLKKHNEKNYVLIFNKEKSIYKEEKKLQIGKKETLKIVSSFTSGSLFKNIKKNIFVKEEEIFGKKFLIVDTIKKLDWKLEKESKQIGNYTVFKATALKKIKEKSHNEKKDTITKQILITAWYTPQIPINNGPGEYCGLPGLILELNTQRTTILCYKIVLNPKEIEEITPPKKGKKVSKKEFNEILYKKTKEMQDNFIEGKSSAGFKIKN